jgi:hypothetical protein
VAITYPLTDFPSSLIANVVVRPVSIVGRTRSPYTGEGQVVVHDGQWWEVDIAFARQKRANAELIEVALLKLNGREGTFLLPPKGAETNRGSAATTPGTPVVAGASQIGNELDVSGLPSGATGYLLVGDYISVGTGDSTHLHKVLSIVNADSAGTAAILIWPSLRESPANGAAVEVQAPKGVFRLTTNTPEWSIDEALIYETSISVEEHI